MRFDKPLRPLLLGGITPLLIRPRLMRGAGESEKPLRADLLSVQQMEQYGAVLAEGHNISDEQAPDLLLQRLADNERNIADACALQIEAVHQKRQITPAAEWLVDNFHLIEEQIRLAKRHLPKGYSRGLPRLAKGVSASLPRVYDLALEVVSHGDGRIELEGLMRFVAAYQKIAPLKLGELWAIPIMLRLALIENLRRLAVQLSESRRSKNKADYWSDQMIEMASGDSTNLIIVTADMARAKVPLDSAFVAEITRRLQGQGPALALPLTWIEQRLSLIGQTIEQMVRMEAQQQAADQVSVSNSIGSLRFLMTTNWRNFVEASSHVEQTLRNDPAGFYARMDFATRDNYRHSIEQIAKHAHLEEDEVAHKALMLAHEKASNADGDERESHVGYYLIDDGLARLEQMTNVEFSPGEKLFRFARRHPLAFYLAAIGLITAAVAYGLAFKAGQDGAGLDLQLGAGALGLVGGSQLGVALVNWVATLVVRPRPLPRLDFSLGIVPSARTLVVVPTMLTRLGAIDLLVEDIEVRFLANRDPHLHYALLTDFADADTETVSGDEDLLRHASDLVAALNRKYSDGTDNIFFLLHRPRRWNAQEKVWMGHERKRGKLGDLNVFLRGGGNAFSTVVGNADILSAVRYVITLDTDTDLPRAAAWQFVGAMAHPLNRPHYDAALGRVTKGYGILQPRVAVSLPGTTASLYARFSGGEPGIDPYTRAVSDVYQDVFDEGSFIGKGIYDVDAFEQALAGRFPENRILSHDLLEGCYARSGLISDVQLYEEYPSRYSTDVARRHRWVRGDWQLAAWLFPRVPGPDGARLKNPLSGLSRWKIFDNLRRSIVPQSLLALLLLGWGFLSAPWFWSLAVVGILFVPSMSAALFDLTRKSRDMTLRQHFWFWSLSIGRHIGHAVFGLTVLPYDAFYMTNAILRALWRLIVSHRLLLEWNPSSEVGRKERHGLVAALRTMWISPALAIALTAFLGAEYQAAVIAAAPVLILWLISPVIVWRLSLPAARREPKLSDTQSVFLHQAARRIWSFFETYVGPEDNWLPPDNVQDYPVTVVAHRTSPTNMGLALLANLAAYDFGYIPAGQVLERTTNTLQTMARLERYRGHFYNWYDTVSLQPLYPIYISTVDSGNLAGHLLTLRPGLRGLAHDSIVPARLFEGIRDTFSLLVQAADGTVPATLKPFAELVESVCRLRPSTLLAVRNVLEGLIADLKEFMGREAEGDTAWWARALSRQCRAALDDLVHLAPWVTMSLAASVFELNGIPTLQELAAYDFEILMAAQRLRSEEDFIFDDIRLPLALGASRARERIAALEQLAVQAGEMAEMEYEFLYDREKRLLAIGYTLDARKRDPSYYDLLASEARLANFVAIAQNQVPQESWFALGRQIVNAGGRPVLRSWSGSMFEYLMPLLVMPNFDHTLLDLTYRNSVARQIQYGGEKGVPWGISESGYNLFDANLNYQYRAFGVPDLGVKRGLADDLVVAPYASVMALMVAPEAACRNLQRLAADGFSGRFGFYEAIDYTGSRLPRGTSHALIQSFMVHHQGMGFLSLAYLLLDQPMQKRFAAEPMFQSAMLLLHEKIPKATAMEAEPDELAALRTAVTSAPEASMRIITTPHTATPEVQLLSNGRYHLMLTNAGGGTSRWNDLNVTRWREDTTRDNWGTFCYIRDVVNGTFWSNAYQPTLQMPKNYEAVFSEGRIEFRRRDGDFETHTEIVVSPEDDIELRRLRVTNRSRNRRTIEVTSYAEVVIAPAAADAAHQAFSNLFVQTEILRQRHAILCTRRPRSIDEKPPWMCHLVSVHGAVTGQVSYETDRMRFIGRGNTIANPQAMQSPAALSGSQGSVLDPIVAIRYQITLEPEQTVIVDLVTGMGESREAVLNLVDRYQDNHLAGRVFELAWTHSQVILRQLNATEADTQLYGRLAGSVIYPDAATRADASVLMRNRRGQSGLWSYAISGDFPIVLVKIRDAANIELVRQMVQAHAYWRLKGLPVDLVIWNEDAGGYRQLLQDQILGLIASGIEAHTVDRPGGIFVRPGDQISGEDRVLLETVARLIITDAAGTLTEQIDRPPAAETRVPRLTVSNAPRHAPLPPAPAKSRPLQLMNGLGGFSTDGREYVIMTAPQVTTPAPWSNVLANPLFGTVISESGGAYSWSENAHSFRLTPWNNDPVTDASGEAFYLRDEESGQFWSPAPRPVTSRAPYVTRHGFGYSVFEHEENGIYSELLVYVAIDAAVKFSVLKIRNESGRARRLSATGYVEWVLGDQRAKTAMHVITEIDEATGAVFARNAYNTEFADRIAFFDVDEVGRTVTGDRREFLGRNGTLQDPAAMRRTRLSGKVGAGLDPCTALQVGFDLADGQEREIVFRLGLAGRNTEEASQFVRRHRGWGGARTAREGVHHHWDHVLGAVQIETPDPALNVLANGWLIYQTIACRLWARSGYYQSGGAFGFRDQLQDAMAVVHCQPHILREQLLLAAAHQFVEGDVQHWWHPPADRGVRTKCSDDYLWLPLALCRYLDSTGDFAILDEQISFLQGRQLNADEESLYDLFARTPDTASLYEHCVRAIQRGFRFGAHGLPLIGSCDWNDGMDRVGERGKGESVWLGFFLFDILGQFKEVARRRDDHDFAVRCEMEAARVQQNIEANAWDGAWYRRAYFDDGTPLGSATNAECQIDSLSQSWSVLSGAGDPVRSRQGMEAVDARLVRRADGLIQLLDPPFDKADLNPGYIRGYAPGVRENGGQYTHAAIWTVMAFAKLGERDKAYELLQLINPVNHARTPAEVANYRVEPYVVTADVYGVAPHVGRGGWSWYTGSSGWMYRLILESLLGLRLEVDKLIFAPCLPKEWTGFKVTYRYRRTTYMILVAETNAGSGPRVTVDGVEQDGNAVPLVDDQRTHEVHLSLPR